MTGHSKSHAKHDSTIAYDNKDCLALAVCLMRLAGYTPKISTFTWLVLSPNQQIQIQASLVSMLDIDTT